MAVRNLDIRVLPDLPAVAAATLDYLDGSPLALSGGRTYRELFPFWVEHLKQHPRSFYPVDERRVSIDSPDSNWGTASRLLFAPAGDTVSPSHAAVEPAAYRRLLKPLGEPPHFRTVFLGMGADGHTASLFPGSPPLNTIRGTVIETTSPAPPYRRITLGPHVLAAADRAVLIITDPRKTKIIKKVIDGNTEYPITQVLNMRFQTILLTLPQVLR